MTAVADAQREAKRLWAEKTRRSGKAVEIPFPVDPGLRAACLDDWQVFLATCFGQIFWQGFTPDRIAMAEAIVFAAEHGGDQAIAGPRGEGKTRLAVYLSLWLMLRRRLRFPVVITKNAKAANEALKLSLKPQLERNVVLATLFPEICAPIRDLGGWASNARKQHVAGHHTDLLWETDQIGFPTLPNDVLELLDRRWADVESCAAGQFFGCVGIEGRIRGWSIRDVRPDLAIIDDIDDQESAKSDLLTEARERIIESDVAGLAGAGETVARVMLCTAVNRRCVAYTYTDPHKKPWNGKRYAAIPELPARSDLWEEFVQMRQQAIESGTDPLGRAADDFYLANREEMHRGAVVANPENYSRKTDRGGRPIEYSALHAFYIKVAKVGWDHVNTEYQQDPPEEGGPEADDLNETMIRSRLSRVPHREIPAYAEKLVAFVDLHKRRLNWGVATWAGGAIGDVIDHGEKPTSAPDVVGAEKAIRIALDELADEIEGKSEEFGAYCKPDGQVLQLDVGLVDSGHWNTVVYEFCQDRGGAWRPSMGDSKYHQPPNRTMQKVPGERWYRSRQKTERGAIWVVNMDADHWKGWAHERLRTEPFENGTGKRRRGSIALYGDDPKAHAEFARQVFAERLVREFVEGKGWVEKWKTFSRNNHFLDVLYGLCVAGNVAGIRLLGEGERDRPKVVAATAGGSWFAQQKGR